MYYGTWLIIKGSVADNSRGTSTWLDLINLTTDPLIIRGPVSVGCNKVKCFTGPLII